MLGDFLLHWFTAYEAVSSIFDFQAKENGNKFMLIKKKNILYFYVH